MKSRFMKFVKLALATVFVVNALFTFVLSSSTSTYAYTNGAMPNGYRPITSQDVGKKFGVELEATIFFSQQYTTNPEAYFPSLRMHDNLNREYYIASLDYQEERPYTYGFAVFNFWQESPSVYFHKELYFYDVVAGEGTWNVMDDPNPHYIVPNGYELDLFYNPSSYSVVWVKDKGGGKIIYSVPFLNVDDGQFQIGNKVPSLPNPEHENRYFVGWYYDSQYNTRALESENIPTMYIKNDGIEDFIILYGRWSIDYLADWEDTYRAVWEQQGYDKGFDIGRGIGQQEGYSKAMDDFGSQEGGLYWLTNILTSIGSILAIEIFPSISIGLLVFIPFAFGLLFWFLKLLKGGGD